MAQSNKKRNKITVKRPIASSDVIGKKKTVAASGPKETKPEVTLPENKDNQEPPAPPVIDPPVTEEPPVTPPITTDPEETETDPEHGAGDLPPAAAKPKHTISDEDDDINDPFRIPVIVKKYATEHLPPPPAEGTDIPDIPEQKFSTPVGGDIPGETGEGPLPDGPDGPVQPGSEGKDLTPAQKRTAAEATAKIIMDLYCSRVPSIFTNFALFPIDKIQKLSVEDKLNPYRKIEVGADKPITINEFINYQNGEIKKAFTVKPETREGIQEPLVDVLLEQGLSLTPTQRLLIAVGMHVGEMGLQCYAISKSNKELINSFKQYHEDDKRIAKEKAEAIAAAQKAA